MVLVSLHRPNHTGCCEAVQVNECAVISLAARSTWLLCCYVIGNMGGLFMMLCLQGALPHTTVCFCFLLAVEMRKTSSTSTFSIGSPVSWFNYLHCCDVMMFLCPQCCLTHTLMLCRVGRQWLCADGGQRTQHPLCL